MLKYIGYSALSLLILILLLMLFTQTRFFKDKLRDFVVEQASNQITGQLFIEHIDGNLFSHLEMKNILIEDESDTVLLIPDVALSYNLINLIYGEITVNKLNINASSLNLNQLPDSSWNIGNLFKRDSLVDDEDLSTSGPFPYQITIDDFYLTEAQIHITANDPLIPRNIHNLDINLSGKYGIGYQEVQLKRFRLQAQDPDIGIEQLSFLFSRAEESITLKNFRLQTTKNDINGEATYSSTKEKKSSAQLKSDHLILDEFQIFMPDIHFKINPKFVLKSNFSNDSLFLDLRIEEGNKYIFLNMQIINPYDILSPATSNKVHYSISGKLSNIDLYQLLGDTETDYLINGAFSIKGSGLKSDEAQISLNAYFHDCILLDNRIDSLSLKGTYLNGALTALVAAQTHLGQLSAEADIRKIDYIPEFNFNFHLDHFDLTHILINDSLNSDITLDLSVKGSGSDLNNIIGVVQLIAAPSKLQDFDIDIFSLNMHLNKGSFLIDSLLISSDLAELAVDGYIDSKWNNNLNFAGVIKDVSRFKKLVGADTLSVNGIFSGNLSGRIDSLLTTASLEFNDIVADDFSSQKLSATVSVTFNQNDINGQGDINLINTQISNIALEEVDIITDFRPDTLNLMVDISNPDSMYSHLEANVTMDSLVKIAIPKLELGYKSEHWLGGNPDMRIAIGNGTYHLQNIELKSTTASIKKQQFIQADGTISTRGEQKLKLLISGLNLEALNSFLHDKIELEGHFYFDMEINGTAESPVIRGSTTIKDGGFNNIAYQKMAGDFLYISDRFDTKFVLYANEQDSIFLSSSLPVNLSFASQNFSIFYNRPLELRTKSEDFSLALLLSGRRQIQEVEGAISHDIYIRNTLNDLRAGGFLKLRDGAFQIPVLGIDYSAITLDVNLDSNLVVLDSLVIRREDGVAKVLGTMEFDSSIVTGRMKAFDFDLQTKRIYMSKHKDFEIQLSANIFLKGDSKEPVFGGRIDLLRSNFFLPALVEYEAISSGRSDLSVPLLVAATHDSIISPIDSLKNGEADKHGDGESSSLFYQNLRGNIRLYVPKNTWIKSENMRMEIAGELDLVKTGPNLELFGNIGAFRGNYDLYGRRFNIKKGDLIFQGGTDFNPNLDLEAEYEFRSGSEKKILKLLLTDKFKKPNLKFMLDEKEISKSDAVSYILFGYGSDNMSYDQKEGISNNQAEGLVAMGLVSSMVSQQLAKSVGSELNLDFVELNAKDNWQRATLGVGKYLTNDLYVSYQREFGEKLDADTPEEIITLEYELIKHFYLHLIQAGAKHSGADLILKVEW